MAKRYLVTRDVAGDEDFNYADRAVRKGEVVYECTVTTYGCVDTTNGIAASFEPDGGYPFFEFPKDAIEEV